MKIFTIGFTKKSAETFFGRLKNSGAKRLIDVRLNNVSQLAGFTKRNDLSLFRSIVLLEEILNEYVVAAVLQSGQPLFQTASKSMRTPAASGFCPNGIRTKQRGGLMSMCPIETFQHEPKSLAQHSLSHPSRFTGNIQVVPIHICFPQSRHPDG